MITWASHLDACSGERIRSNSDFFRCVTTTRVWKFTIIVHCLTGRITVNLSTAALERSWNYDKSRVCLIPIMSKCPRPGTKKGRSEATQQCTYRARCLRSAVAPQRCRLSSAGAKLVIFPGTAMALIELFFRFNIQLGLSCYICNYK